MFDNSIPLSRIVSLKGGSQYLSDVLKQAFDKSDIAYEIVGKQIVLQKVQTKTNRTISGVVKDEQGEAVIGASVLVKVPPTVRLPILTESLSCRMYQKVPLLM